MRRILSFVAPVVAAGLLAACVGGTPSSIPASNAASSASRTTLDKVKAATASPASLTFASPTAASQNDTISFQTGDINHVTVTVAPANLVTVATCQTTTTTRGNSSHGDDDDRDNDNDGDNHGNNHTGNCGADSHTLVYTVTPKTAGTGTITFTTKNGDDGNHAAPVVVPVNVAAGGPGPLTVVTNPADGQITCPGTAPSTPGCTGTLAPVVNALPTTPQLPEFTLSVSETNYSGNFTLTNNDTNCAVPTPGTTTFANASPSASVVLAMTESGFESITVVRGTSPVSPLGCSVTIADDHGGSQTLTLDWQL